MKADEQGIFQIDVLATCPPHFWQLDGKYVGVCKKCQLVKTFPDPSRPMTLGELRAQSKIACEEIRAARKL